MSIWSDLTTFNVKSSRNIYSTHSRKLNLVLFRPIRNSFPESNQRLLINIKRYGNFKSLRVNWPEERWNDGIKSHVKHGKQKYSSTAGLLDNTFIPSSFTGINLNLQMLFGACVRG